MERRSDEKKRSRHLCRLPAGQEREGVPSARRREARSEARMAMWSEEVN